MADCRSMFSGIRQGLRNLHPALRRVRAAAFLLIGGFTQPPADPSPTLRIVTLICSLPAGFLRSFHQRKRLQRTLNAQALGVQIPHGGFQRLVTHGLLNSARVGASFQTVRRVTRNVANRMEQGLSIAKAGGMAQVNRAFGPQGINALQGLMQNFLVKEEDRIESLVLGAGRQIPFSRDPIEEAFQLLLAGKPRRHVPQGGHALPQPVDIVGFGGKRFVLAAKHVSQLIDRVRRIQNKSERRKCGGKVEKRMNNARRRGAGEIALRYTSQQSYIKAKFCCISTTCGAFDRRRKRFQYTIQPLYNKSRPLRTL
jgi:hypothetical protein